MPIKQEIVKTLIMSSVCLFVACGHGGKQVNNQLMQQAQLLMEQQPDSALVLLQRVDATLLDTAQHAAYTLLQIQAKDKANRDIAADTAIFGARDYFVAAEDNPKAALAWFYTGRVYQEQGNTNVALLAYLDAERIAGSLKGEDHLKGLIQFMMGQIYFKDMKPGKALERYRDAAGYLRAAGQQAKEIRAVHAIGTSFLANEQFDSALYYFNKASAMPAFDDDPALQSSVMQNIGLIAQYTGNPEEARKLLSQALKQAANDHAKAQLYVGLADAYRDLHLRDSASFCIARALDLCRKIEDGPMAAVYETLTETEKNNGNYKKALEYTQMQLEYERTVFEESEKKRLAEIEQKYNYRAEQDEKEILALKVKNRGLWIIVVIAGSLVVLSAGVLQVRKWMAGKNQKINQLKQDVHKANSTVAELQDAIARERETIMKWEQEKALAEKNRKDEIDAAIGKKERDIDQMLEEIRNSCVDQLKAYFLIYNKLENLFRNKFDKNEEKALLEKFDGFIFGEGGVVDWEIVRVMIPETLEDKIAKEYTLLKPGIAKRIALDTTEVKVCCLKMFEVSNYHIAKTLHITLESLYTKNNSIKRKLRLTNVEDVQETLKYLLGR